MLKNTFFEGFCVRIFEANFEINIRYMNFNIYSISYIQIKN